MTNSANNADAFTNHLLSSLSREGRERFAARMQRVEVGAQQVLYAPNERIADIYFPEDCVLSMLTIMKNGQSIESATVGREGASWISASFRSPTMPCQTIAAIAGHAFKVPANVVESEIKENGDFHNVLSHYSHMLLIQTLRATACNGLHSLQQRCARWMLMTLDRIDMSRFVITHEFLASLLGVQRTGVSQLVAQFASQGIVEQHRGYIHVTDRAKLEPLSCECYELVKAQYALLR